MGLNGASDLPEDGDGDGKAGDGGKAFVASAAVSCSICLDVVKDDGERSWAKLQCGHQFHLDCIGSAFNVKGVMQCPNCRKVEKGQWLYANSCRPFPEFSMDDWTHDEDHYDLSYSEMSFGVGVHWCPFSGLTRLPSSLDEGDFLSTAHHDLLGQHAIFAEHSTMSSAMHPCPYIAYFGPFHPSSTNSSGSISDLSSFSNPWNGPSIPSDTSASFGFPSMDLHYNTWEHHSPPFATGSGHINGTDRPSMSSVVQRLTQGNSDVPRSGAFVHPFHVDHLSSSLSAGSSVPPIIPSYPGSNARAIDRVQALQAYYQQPPSNSLSMRGSISGNRRSSGHRGGMTPIGSVPFSSDPTGGFYFFPSGAPSQNFQEQENSISTHFVGWERDHFPLFPLSQVDRDSSWGPVNQATSGSDSGFRPSSYHQRRGASQNRS